MKRLTGLLVFLLLVGTAQSQPSEADTDYYPLKVGTKWFYQVKTGNMDDKIILQVAKKEKIDEKELFRLETVKDGNVLANEHLSSSSKGVFRNRFNGAEASPPVQLLKYPIKAGETWKEVVTVAGQKIPMTCKVGQDDVTVPAGKFKAVTVQIDAEVGDTKITTTYWFVQGKGPVKQTADIAGTKVTMELEKVEMGK
jgi:hypothetical protein